MPKNPMPREECLKLLLGETLAGQLRGVPLGDLTHLDDEPPLASLHHLYEWDRQRLRAAVRFTELFAPAGTDDVTRLAGAADVVRTYAPRCATLVLPTVWVVSVDEERHVIQEVLVKMGGHLGDVPPLRQLLRHLLLRGAVGAYIVDFRPLERLHPHPPTIRALRDLRAVGELVGAMVHDWVILAPRDAMSVADQLCTVAAEGRRKRAA